jgi:membrane protease YdiL (CAAX protease family)
MIKTFCLLVIGSLVGALALTPLVVSLIELFFPDRFGWPFSRVFDRVAMALAALIIFVLRRQFSLQEMFVALTKGSLVYKFRLILTGICITLITSAAVLFFAVGDGELRWVSQIRQDFWWKISWVIPAALLISCIEESFFRSLLLNRLAERFAFWPAAVISSILYAVVHFIAPVKDFNYQGWDPFAGINYFFAVIDRMGSAGVGGASIGLFFVGMILCFVVRTTGSLLLCVGLHSGWVISMKVARFVTEAESGYIFASGIGHRYFLVAEPLAWGSLLLVGLAAYVVHVRGLTKT